MNVLSPARGKIRKGTSGVDRSQAVSAIWGDGPRKGDWSDLWLDVIMRRLPTSDRSTIGCGGVSDAALIGARVEVTASGMKQYRWLYSSHSYKSGGAHEAHFGLGRHERADATVILINGRRYDFSDLKAGRYPDVNPSTRTVSEVRER